MLGAAMTAASGTPPVAVVTGGGGDIGGAICHRLRSSHYALVVADVDLAAAEATAESLRRVGGRARAERVDVTDGAEFRALVDRVFSEAGGLAALVNNVGIEGAVQPVHRYPEDVFERVMRVNAHSVFLGMRAALPHMLAAGAGVIVNLASTSAIRGRANLAGYVASKHAVLGLTRVAALETIGTGVRVNAVLPGPIETRMIRAINAGARALVENVDGDAQEGPIRRSTRAPYGSVADVAGVVAYLVSDEARHVNGAAWVVDGGSIIA